ncbi:MAG: hypothetical protein KAU95_02355, partial [Candidatus Aenigmarchaeota archaeon]|nr:hypothetical protein [Candidatus Aenigmarchaeota archaeon]
MLCNITSNKTHYNASERLAFNEVKLVGEGVNEWEGFKEGKNVTHFKVEPLEINKTVATNNYNVLGEITVTSNSVDCPLPINIGFEGDGEITLTENETQFTLNVYNESKKIRIYYNTTLEGIFNGNITVFSNKTGEVIKVNTTMEVLHLEVNIISPNQSDQIINVTNGTVLSIKANALFKGTEITNETNETDKIREWMVYVEQEQCEIINYSYENNSWVINCAAPWLPDNKINASLKVVGIHRIDNVTDIKEKVIIYENLIGPIISEISANSTEVGGNVTIEFNLTDDSSIHNFWISIENINDRTINGNVSIRKDGEIEYSNSTNSSKIELPVVYVNNKNSNVSVFLSNLSKGDYDIIVCANDTDNLSRCKEGWFDVHELKPIIGNTSEQIELGFEFFRPGTNKTLLTAETNNSFYNITKARNRTYDTVVYINTSAEFNESAYRQLHEVKFRSLNILENATTPVIIKYVNLSKINLTQEENIEKTALCGFYIKLNNTTAGYTSPITIQFNYSEIPGMPDREVLGNNLRAYKCESYNYNNCSWANSSNTLIINTTEYTVKFNVSSLSSFILTEESSSSEENESEDKKKDDDSSSSSSGGGATGAEGASDETETETENENETEKATGPFSAESSLKESIVYLGENRTYFLRVINHLTRQLYVNLSVDGDIKEILELEKRNLTLYPEADGVSLIQVSIPTNAELRGYTGNLIIEGANISEKLPVTIVTSLKEGDLIELKVKVITKKVEIGKELKSEITIKDVGINRLFNISLFYSIKDPDTDRSILNLSRNLTLNKYASLVEEIAVNISSNLTGVYYLHVTAKYFDRENMVVDSFEIVEIFWTQQRTIP